jgi:hypothetical protein
VNELSNEKSRSINWDAVGEVILLIGLAATVLVCTGWVMMGK